MGRARQTVRRVTQPGLRQMDAPQRCRARYPVNAAAIVTGGGRAPLQLHRPVPRERTNRDRFPGQQIWYLCPAIDRRPTVTYAAQQRATGNYRARLEQRGFKRFEAMALETDREMLRTLARRLAEGGPEADRARAAVKALIADGLQKPGGILAALRRSPLVGADLDLSRPRAEGRRIDL